MVAEHLGTAQQGDELTSPPPVRPDQQVRPVHLEPELPTRALHPVHHPRIQELISKLTVLGLHLEHAVELLGLELDVVEAEMAGHPARHALAALLPGPPREVGDDGHAGKDQNEDHRPHHWQYDQPSPGGERSGPPRWRSTTLDSS